MDFQLYLDYAPLLFKGILYTVSVCVGALIIGLLLGLILCLIGQQTNKASNTFYRLYITLFRGTPFLVQVYLVYYGGPFVGIELSAVQVGVLGLGLYTSAYFAEIFRAGFESIPKGQIEAAIDLGFSPSQILLHVRIPQMLALILPSILNQTILLVKDSAILSVITVPEMTTSATRMSTETFSVIEPYLFLGLSYWLITFGLTKIAQNFESRATHYLMKN